MILHFPCKIIKGSKRAMETCQNKFECALSERDNKSKRAHFVWAEKEKTQTHESTVKQVALANRACQ